MTTSQIQGYAEFGLSVAAGLLEYVNEQSATSYTSIYMKGTAFMDGDDVSGVMKRVATLSRRPQHRCAHCHWLRQHPSTRLRRMHVFYDSADANNSAVYLDRPGGVKMLINSTVLGSLFVWGAGMYTDCLCEYESSGCCCALRRGVGGGANVW